MLELKLKLQFSEFQLITLFISSRLFNSVSLGLGFLRNTAAAAAAAKSLQSCPTPCDPHRRQPTRLPRSWDSPGKNTGVGCHFLLQCMKVKVKLLNRVRPQQPQGPQPSRLLPPWDFPGKNIGVGCHFLLQEIFLTQGLNLCLLCLLQWQEDILALGRPHLFYYIAINPATFREKQNKDKWRFQGLEKHPV